MTTVADTGFAVALGNQGDQYHANVKRIYAGQTQILLPQTVLAEVAYLLSRDAGNAQLVQFLEALPTSRFQPICLTDQDFARSAAILKLKKLAYSAMSYSAMSHLQCRTIADSDALATRVALFLTRCGWFYQKFHRTHSIEYDLSYPDSSIFGVPMCSSSEQSGSATDCSVCS